MKKDTLVYVVVSCLLNLNAQAQPNSIRGPGDPVVDEELFQSIREKYDGSFKGSYSGQVGTEDLADGRIIIGFLDRVAEYAFYNLPKASEDIRYIPSKIDRNGKPRYYDTNYFDRQGKGIICGMVSEDLRKFPLPSFVCRFAVDSKGIVAAFVDRPGARSRPKDDFHYLGGDSIINKIGRIHVDSYLVSNDISREEANEATRIIVEGKAGMAIYRKLSVPAKAETLDPTYTVYVKRGAQIQCFTSSPRGDSASCTTVIRWNGDAVVPTSRW